MRKADVISEAKSTLMNFFASVYALGLGFLLLGVALTASIYTYQHFSFNTDLDQILTTVAVFGISYALLIVLSAPLLQIYYTHITVLDMHDRITVLQEKIQKLNGE